MARKPATSRPVVGLDIEPGHVAAVQVRPSDLSVEKAATATLEPGLVRDGEIADVEGLAAALRALWAEHKLPRKVRLGVANQRIVVRTMDLPPLTDAKEIAAAVRFGAQDHIPMPLDQAVLDHQSTGVVETPEGPRCRVVVVAARRDMIDPFLAVARGASTTSRCARTRHSRGPPPWPGCIITRPGGDGRRRSLAPRPSVGRRAPAPAARESSSPARAPPAAGRSRSRTTDLAPRCKLRGVRPELIRHHQCACRRSLP